MAIVRVQIPKDNKQTQDPMRDLFWYDTVLKKMLKFQGTRLEFDYLEDAVLKEAGHKNPYRLLPKVVVAEKVEVKDKNIERVLRWFRDFKNYNDSEAEMLEMSRNKKPDSVCFEVSDEEVDDFCDDLKNNKFNYQVL